MISGLLLIRWTWPSIFWFLSISSAVILVTMLLLLPETGRNIVGNGSKPVKSPGKLPLLRKPIMDVLEAAKSIQSDTDQDQNPRGASNSFNPFSSILMLKDPGTLIASICFGIYYMVHTCLQASLSTVFVDIYQVSGLVAGLIYIPFGLGCSIASFIAGKKQVSFHVPCYLDLTIGQAKSLIVITRSRQRN